MKVMEYINAHRNDEEPCECVILPDGEVEEPLPSHIEMLEKLAGEEPSVLNGHMEKSMEPLFWLAEYTRSMSVWQTRVVAPAKPTEAQMETLEELYNAAFLEPGYLMQKAEEAYVDSVKRARVSMASSPAGENQAEAAEDRSACGANSQENSGFPAQQ